MYILCIYYGERIISEKKALGICLIASIAIAFGSATFTISQIQGNGFFFLSNGILLFLISINIVQTLVLATIFKGIPKTFVFFIVTMISAIVDLSTYITEYTKIYGNGIDAAVTYLQKCLVRVPFLIISFILIYALIKLLKKIKAIDVMKVIINNTKVCIFAAVIMIFSKLVSMRVFSNAKKIFGDDYDYTLYILFMLTVILMVVLLVRSYISDMRRKEMKSLMGQQKNYLKRLEEIQKKLRVINHDYKNVAAGLYLSAESGDIEEVKNYVNNQLLMLDHDIQAEISQMNQLINIKEIELKSLLITKIAKAADSDIMLDIEISNTVGKINMSIDDLLRSIGILVDNAIEEAVMETDTSDEIRKVKLLIFEDENITNIIIKNRYRGEIPLNKIVEQGYSTKGEGRGLGLYSLKEILKKYQNVFTETKLEDGWFVQIIKII